MQGVQLNNVNKLASGANYATTMNFFRRSTGFGFAFHQRCQSTLLHHLNSTKAASFTPMNQPTGQFPARMSFQCNSVRNWSCVPNGHKAFLQTSRTSNQSSIFSFIGLQSIRCKARGNEYQPNVRKRLRKHGYHKRMKTISGMEILWKRMLKGRTLLVHGNFNRKPFKGV